MLSEAIEQIARAERMHRQFFSLKGATEPQLSSWEPPIDVLETDDEILIFVALPGVDPEDVEAIITDGAIVVRGQRVLPEELQNALIHRLELPQGRFERRIALPAGHYAVSRFAAKGCVVLRLAKSA
jgi:HSP20 family molecular chaperone IbpA